jgi:hypothetical protein
MWLSEEERDALDRVATDLGVSRNQITRTALRTLLGLPVSDRLVGAVWAETEPRS